MPPSRIVVLDTVHFQPHGEQPITVGQGFSRFIMSEEGAYLRPMTVGEEWQPLDLGWLKDTGTGMVYISNEEGRNLRDSSTSSGLRQTIPSAEEKADIAGRIVQLAVVGGANRIPFGKIRPGESCRFEPDNDYIVAIKCAHGKARITLFICPS